MQASADFEPYVDKIVAAEYLAIDEKTLLRKVREGMFPGHPIDPTANRRDWRFKLSELDATMRQRVSSMDRPSLAKGKSRVQ